LIKIFFLLLFNKNSQLLASHDGGKKIKRIG